MAPEQHTRVYENLYFWVNINYDSDMYTCVHTHTHTLHTDSDMLQSDIDLDGKAANSLFFALIFMF